MTHSSPPKSAAPARRHMERAKKRLGSWTLDDIRERVAQNDHISASLDEAINAACDLAELALSSLAHSREGKDGGSGAGAPPFDPWRPISTAPKDGTEILVWHVGSKYIRSGRYVGYLMVFPHVGYEVVVGATCYPLANFSHWSELPSPPIDSCASQGPPAEARSAGATSPTPNKEGRKDHG